MTSEENVSRCFVSVRRLIVIFLWDIQLDKKKPYGAGQNEFQCASSILLSSGENPTSYIQHSPLPPLFLSLLLAIIVSFFFSYLFIYLFLKSEFVFLIRVPLPVKTWNKKNSERERGGFSLLVLVMHHKLVERGKEKKKKRVLDVPSVALLLL